MYMRSQQKVREAKARLGFKDDQSSAPITKTHGAGVIPENSDLLHELAQAEEDLDEDGEEEEQDYYFDE